MTSFYAKDVLPNDKKNVDTNHEQGIKTRCFVSAKLPKHCDPNNPPDPERWLPRRERSYYKGKRRDKRKDIGKNSVYWFPFTTSSAPMSKRYSQQGILIDRKVLKKTATTSNILSKTFNLFTRCKWHPLHIVTNLPSVLIQ